MRRPSDSWVDPQVVLDVGDVVMGNVSIVGPVTMSGNVTLSDSKTFIGLVTVGGGTAWTDPKAFIGLVSVGGGIIQTRPSYSYKQFVSASTIQVKSSAGVLHSFTVGAPSCPSIVFWDSAVPSGTKIFSLSGNYPRGSYVMDVAFANGLSLDAITNGTGDIVPEITVSYS
jgi:hypothetical protein